MPIFFDSIETLQSFSLEQHSQLNCRFCFQSQHFISHGFVYKQESCGQSRIVGKRLFCTNRYGRSGCGRTVQLYLSTELPSCRYASSVLFLFIAALLAGSSVASAYFMATGTEDSRHAWRWLSKLNNQLGRFRTKVRQRVIEADFKHRSHRLQLLLPTLNRLFCILNEANPCATFQQRFQAGFLTA